MNSRCEANGWHALLLLLLAVELCHCKFFADCALKKAKSEGSAAFMRRRSISLTMSRVSD
jgi:hypothetical protein